MLDYYRQKAMGNPLKTLILERAMEKKGGIPHNFDTLPDVIKTYLSERGFKNEADAQALIAPGATLVLSILWVMKDLSTGAEVASRPARARQASQIANDAPDPIVLAWEAEEKRSELRCCSIIRWRQLRQAIASSRGLPKFRFYFTSSAPDARSDRQRTS